MNKCFKDLLINSPDQKTFIMAKIYIIMLKKKDLTVTSQIYCGLEGMDCNAFKEKNILLAGQLPQILTFKR